MSVDELPRHSDAALRKAEKSLADTQAEIAKLRAVAQAARLVTQSIRTDATMEGPKRKGLHISPMLTHDVYALADTLAAIDAPPPAREEFPPLLWRDGYREGKAAELAQLRAVARAARDLANYPSTVAAGDLGGESYAFRYIQLESRLREALAALDAPSAARDDDDRG